MKLEEAKSALNAKKDKAAKVAKKAKAAKVKVAKKFKTPGIGWEIGAYAVRSISVATPAVIIMTLENSWVKTGLGLLATFVIIALILIFKEPIKKASDYAPGAVIFTIFIVIAIFFKTVSNVLLTVGISGVGGSILSVPLHVKYLSAQKQEKSPELLALEQLAEKLK